MLKRSNVELKDSMNYVNFKLQYVTQQIDLAFKEGNRAVTLEKVLAYHLKDGKRQQPFRLSELATGNKRKLIIRYTEIGCNQCADKVVSLIKSNKGIERDYETIVLVDFSNYDSYLKWRKISEVDFPVFWVKKGDMPYGVEKDNNSYVFVLNPNAAATSFFIPDSRFESYIATYVNTL
ncbi:hypothetical protein FPE01S_01_09660 [Flavihumibacter petaseus NBRC 106054]|uniref:Thioredoxin domain-containing protein n=2 Tax=Flavihumibacter TaxID=1004301 RepID=A0A0E9MWS8_9BACT|nr:hypothetical protein FPE01S_01_09660 [Flavihumibacter petaseus NBRC 106054]